MDSGFAVFILTHGRCGGIKTDTLLRRRGYTGPIYYLVDDEDEQLPLYMETYGDAVVVFDKRETARHVDAADNFGNRRCVLYARHAVAGIAADMGLRYYQTFDDDAYSLGWRWADGDVLMSREVTDYDSVVSVLVGLLEDTGAMAVAIAQGGDFIGGVGSSNERRDYSRKCMNTFIMRAGMTLDFKGTMNEDVAAYTLHGMRGDLLLTVNCLCVAMTATQAGAGGMSAEYLETGTYVKTAYSLVTSPSCVSVGYMEDHSRGGGRGGRIHHIVHNDRAYVRIVPESCRKP